MKHACAALSLWAAIAVVLPSGSDQPRELRNLAYYEGPGAHPRKHKLDLFLPSASAGHPVLVFVHGGSWKRGDKDAYGGAYGAMGRSLAAEGVAVAVINYRLTPEVRHPEHARDVARAVGWVHGNASRYGWNPGKIVLVGHSAGAHLCSLAALDPAYLEEHGLSPEVIGGVVAVSGVYDLTRTGVTGQLLYQDVFGTRNQQLQAASPALQVQSKPAPFLLLYAAQDYPTADYQTRRLENALSKSGGTVRSLEIADRNHVNIIAGLGRKGDPVREEILRFLKELFPSG